MDFTPGYKHSSTLPSPCCRYFASVYQNKVIIRDAESLDNIKTVSTPSTSEVISDLDWSHDSALILGIAAKTENVYVWSVGLKGEDKWRAVIETEDACGVKAAKFAPDGRSVMVWSDSSVRLAVWPLVRPKGIYEAQYIPNPKNGEKGIAMRRGSAYVAVLQKKDYIKDYVEVYDARAFPWISLGGWALDTQDASTVSWSPCGRYLIIQESMAMEARILVYTADGRLLATYVPEDATSYLQLGIRSIAWSPKGDLLAVSCYDQRVRIMNHYTWDPFITLEHGERILITSKTKVFREMESQVEVSSSMDVDGSMIQIQAKYEVLTPPKNAINLPLPLVRPKQDTPNPRIGAAHLDFSPCGEYLLVHNAHIPSVLFLYLVQDGLKLSVLIQMQNPIRQARWCPTVDPKIGPRLAWTCGTGGIDQWTRKWGAESVEVPHKMNVMGIRWRGDGGCVIMSDKDVFCVGYLVDEEEEDEALEALADEMYRAGIGSK